VITVNVNRSKFEKMTVKFIGDSNFRDLFTAHKASIEDDTGEDIEFIQATSVASVKTYIEVEEACGIIFIGCPINEISLKSKNNTKSREGIVEAVINDLFAQVNTAALKHDKSLFVICQPFLRLDPPWIETKMNFINEFIRTTNNSSNPGNVHLGSVYEITAADLKSDNIHLNPKGIEKLKKVVTSDIKIAKVEQNILRNGPDPDESMEEDEADHQPVVQEGRNLRKTPARNKKTVGSR
jgi:hypothetical protein